SDSLLADRHGGGGARCIKCDGATGRPRRVPRVVLGWSWCGLGVVLGSSWVTLCGLGQLSPGQVVNEGGTFPASSADQQRTAFRREDLLAGPRSVQLLKSMMRAHKAGLMAGLMRSHSVQQWMLDSANAPLGAQLCRESWSPKGNLQQIGFSTL